MVTPRTRLGEEVSHVLPRKPQEETPEDGVTRAGGTLAQGSPLLFCALRGPHLASGHGRPQSVERTTRMGDRSLQQRTRKWEPSLGTVALSFMFCMPLGLVLAYRHSAFRENGKVDRLIVAAVIVFALLMLYNIALAIFMDG